MSVAAADELELGRSLDASLAAILTMPRLLEGARLDDHLPDELQRALLGLTWNAIAVEERHGGLGVAPHVRARLAAVAGRRLLPASMRGEAFVLAPALALLASAGDSIAEEELQRLLAGELRGAAAVATGPWRRDWRDAPARTSPPHDPHDPDDPDDPDDHAGKLYACVPPGAELLACVGRGWATVIDIGDVELRRVRGLDPGQGLAEVALPRRGDDASPAAGRTGDSRRRRQRRLPAAAAGSLRREWLLALLSECCGAGGQALELSVDYARQREQFGQRIASFQAVSHTLARMAVALEASDAGIGRLCAEMDESHGSEVIELAAAHAIPAAMRSVCESAIQVHGGVGFSWELGLHLYYRRVLSIQYLLGGDGATAAALGAHTFSEREASGHRG
ncbi:MAG: acyl-CoA dehydrogenase family protein [Solirubrobacteraceae bacterium]